MANSHLKLVAPVTENRTVATPLRRKNVDLRTREYLTDTEVERLMTAAKANRYGHRAATMAPARWPSGGPSGAHRARRLQREQESASPFVFPCVHAVATTPAQRLGVLFALLHPAVSAFPERVVGSACALSFSRFTHVTACTLALSPIRDTLIEGFSHFVASMTAPIASGWSGCRVGLTPTGKRRLVTAHTHTKTSKA